MTQQNPTRFERNRKKVIAVLLLFGFLLIELILRMVLHILQPSPEPTVVTSNPLTHHDYRPNVEFTRFPSQYDSFHPVVNKINSFGIRGPEIQPKSCYRVLFVGDSFIQADEVEFSDTFSSRLNDVFKGKIEFLSHGMSSWSPITEFSWVHHKGILLQPDEIYIFLCINDFYRKEVYSMSDAGYRDAAVWEDGVPVRYEKPSLAHLSLEYRLKNLVLQSKIIYVIHRGFRTLIPKKRDKNEVLSKAPDSYADETILLSRPSSEWPADLLSTVNGTIDVVELFSVYCKKKGIRFVVAMVPMPWAWPDENVYGKRSPEVNWASDFTVSQDGIDTYLYDKLTTKGIPFIDLYKAFNSAKMNSTNKELLYNEEDGHWNREGHAVLTRLFVGIFSRVPAEPGEKQCGEPMPLSGIVQSS